MAITKLPIAALASEAGSFYLGPARVVVADGAGVVVERAGRRMRARLALAYGYLPRAGDDLLVISDGEQHFVIGLVRAQGELAFDFPGDVRLSARDLELTADEGIRLESPYVALRARTIHVVADLLKETSRRLYREVRGLLSQRSGDKQEVVEGEHVTRAGGASLIGRDVVSLNGREIHIG